MEKTSRLTFIDLHRGLVLLLMIEVHVFNAFLIPEYKEAGWFSILTFINGLVAPSFLFISGFAFILASQKKIKEFRNFGWQFYRQIGRISLILIAGYSLRLPYFSYSLMMQSATPEQWQQFFAVDVLQCIAIALFLLFFLRLVIFNDLYFKYTVAFFTLFFVLLAPYFWNTTFTGNLHPFFLSYLNQETGSLFPLFPWAGFLFLGAFLSILFSEFRARQEEYKYFAILRNTAIVFIFLGSLFYFGGSPLHIPMLKPEITFFFLRAGYIILIFYICFLFGKKEGWVIKTTTAFGRESLLIYWLHLQVIYRKFAGGSLNDAYHQSFDIAESVMAALVLMALMIGAAYIWSAGKQKFPKYFTYGTPALMVILFIIYFIK